MEAKELRIGNYVKRYLGANEYKTIVVKSISETGELTYIDDKTLYIVRNNFDSIHPIILTEELLINVGFIKNEDDEFKKYSFHLENRATDEFSKDINKEDFGVWICDLYIREVRFVHELQNLFFSIFNEELKLK